MAWHIRLVSFMMSSSPISMKVQAIQPGSCPLWWVLPTPQVSIVIYNILKITRNSIIYMLLWFAGPISSSFVNRYGCRAVTIAGAIFAAACIVASIFAQNVLTLIFTIGIGAGFGLGLIYLPAIVSVTTWFEAKRSLATGIAVCGSGFGTFVFAPLTEHLIGSFGWRGAMLIIGGIVLNCILFGALFRPLEPPKPTKAQKSDIIDNNTTTAELKPLKSGTNEGDQYLQLPQRADAALCRSNSVGHGFNSNNVSA